MIAGPSSNGKFQSDGGDAPYVELIEGAEGETLPKKLWEECLGEMRRAAMKTLEEADDIRQRLKYLSI